MHWKLDRAIRIIVLYFVPSFYICPVSCPPICKKLLSSFYTLIFIGNKHIQQLLFVHARQIFKYFMVGKFDYVLRLNHAHLPVSKLCKINRASNLWIMFKNHHNSKKCMIAANSFLNNEKQLCFIDLNDKTIKNRTHVYYLLENNATLKKLFGILLIGKLVK